MKSRYLFEDRGTDKRTESILECTLKDLSNDIWHAYQSWKLVGDEENNSSTSPVTLGRGIIILPYPLPYSRPLHHCIVLTI